MVRLAAPLRPLFPYLKPVYTFGTGIVAPSACWRAARGAAISPRASVRTLEEAAHVGGGRCQTVRTQELALRPVPVFGHPDLRRPLGRGHRSRRGGRAPRRAGARPPRRGGHPHGPRGRGGQPLLRHTAGAAAPDVPPAVPAGAGRRARPCGRARLQGWCGELLPLRHRLLPRIAMVERCPDLEPPDLWYVPASSPDRRALLDLMGITADRRIDSTSVPHLRAETLVVPGVPGDEQHPPWVTEFLRGAAAAGAVRADPRPPPVPHEGPVEEQPDHPQRGRRHGGPRRPGVPAPRPEHADHGGRDPDLRRGGRGRVRARRRPDQHRLHAARGRPWSRCSRGATSIPCYWKLANTLPDVSYRYLAGVGSRIASNRQKMLVKDITVDVDALLDDPRRGALTPAVGVPDGRTATLASRSAAGPRARPLSSVVEHFHGKEGVVGSIPTEGSVWVAAPPWPRQRTRGGVAQMVRALGS